MADRSLGIALIAIGLLLGLGAVAWLVANALTGMLAAGGFILGIFILVAFIFPMVAAGVYILQRGRAREIEGASFETRRKLWERDRMFRQTLQREATRAAGLVGGKASEAEGDASTLLRQAQQSLESLAGEASEQVQEVDWLHAATLAPEDVRDVERYDDLLLAGVRRIREEAEQGSQAAGPEGAQELLTLARSAERQFALRQDLVLRGRRLPPVGPLHLLRPEIPERGQAAPESMRPGGAVTRDSQDYLVTAHMTYFEGGRNWHALVLRGEAGERRLQFEPGDSRALFMEPTAPGGLPGRTVAAGSASTSIDSLSGAAEGIVVDFRRTEGDGEEVGWWERWPEGEKAYIGRWVVLSELRFWPAAVAGEQAA